MSKVYRINTKEQTVSCEFLKDEYKSFGNRGLVAKFMMDEVDPQCDPLGAENKLIFATGLFAGTQVSTANRLSVGGKSPLTGGIKEANVGGNAGYFLAQHDIKMIVIEDIPVDDGWKILKIGRDGELEILPGDDYVNLNTYAVTKKAFETYGEKIAVICIGPAGEKQQLISTLQCTETGTGHPSRAAARGGLGAVAGSKKIKAIIIEKSDKKAEITYVDKQKFDTARKRMNQSILAEDNKIAGTFKKMGTIVNAMGMNPQGIMPVYNFRATGFEPEKMANCDIKTWLTKAAMNGGKNGISCQPGCLVQCSNCYHDDAGEYVTSGFEYETYALCGPNCGIDDLDTMCRMDRLCDEYGLDTIDTGAAIALCMEAGKLEWGDGPGALNLIHGIIEGTELGIVMAQGADRTGKYLGLTRIPTVKGQAMAGYDPRNLKGLGVTYATSPMGADHTAGLSMGPSPEANQSKEGQVAASAQVQNFSAIADNCMCLFCLQAIATDLPVLGELMAGLYGEDWNFNRLGGVAAQTLQMERQFNKAAGLTSEDDRLPDFFYTEPSPLTGAVFDITPEEMNVINAES